MLLTDILRAMHELEQSHPMPLKAIYLHPDDMLELRRQVAEVAVYPARTAMLGAVECMGVPVYESAYAKKGLPIFDPPVFYTRSEP